MTTEELRERLAAAGKKHDGHVTNGSLDEQMKVVLEALQDECPGFYGDEEHEEIMWEINDV